MVRYNLRDFVGSDAFFVMLGLMIVVCIILIGVYVGRYVDNNHLRGKWYIQQYSKYSENICSDTPGVKNRDGCFGDPLGVKTGMPLEINVEIPIFSNDLIIKNNDGLTIFTAEYTTGLINEDTLTWKGKCHVDGKTVTINTSKYTYDKRDKAVLEIEGYDMYTKVAPK